MRLFITGGAGFLGSNLAMEGLRRGEAVCIFDDLSRLGSESNLNWLMQTHPQLEFIRGDIRDSALLEESIRHHHPDVVFHVAGQVAMSTSIAEPRRDYECNALGTFNVLEACRTHAPHAAILFSSTNKVYGDLEHLRYERLPTRWSLPDLPHGIDETFPLDFRTPYGVSKGSADQQVVDAFRTFGQPTLVFRHSSMYGGRQFATLDQGWVGWFCSQMLRYRAGNVAETTICGDGLQVRDLLHVDDMVELYFAATAKVRSVAGSVYNIGGGQENALSVLELLAELSNILRIDPIPVRHLPTRASDQRVFIADIRRAQRAFGWRPRVSLTRGLKAALQWGEECLHHQPD
jgi:CDP-paratose 2-epimerase